MMPCALSVDLRRRVVDFVLSGYTRRQAAAHFSISVSSAVRIVHQFITSGRIEARSRGGFRYSKLESSRNFLICRIEESPDITMLELSVELERNGVRVHPGSVARWFRQQGYSYKKNTAGQRAKPL